MHDCIVAHPEHFSSDDESDSDVESESGDSESGKDAKAASGGDKSVRIHCILPFIFSIHLLVDLCCLVLVHKISCPLTADVDHCSRTGWW